MTEKERNERRKLIQLLRKLTPEKRREAQYIVAGMKFTAETERGGGAA